LATFLDTLLPAIIVGFLIMIIANINIRLMGSQLESRVSGEMQLFAQTAMDIIQEEIRSLDQIGEVVNPGILEFINVDNEMVRISRNNRDLVIQKSINGTISVIPHSVRLSKLEFSTLSKSGMVFLEVSIQTQALSSEVVMDGNYQVKAVAKREFFLRNVD